MEIQLQKLSGIHPGIILDRELKRRKIAKGRFALSMEEFPQTITAITKGRRGMNTALALKIESALGLQEGYFMMLQVYYEIARIKREQAKTHPLTTKLRAVLFWDTRFDLIDWEKHKAAVIKRVFERGTEEEKQEIIKYYGQQVIDSVLGKNEH
jgi:plasmid maintenance system antidote protein VapI